MRDTFGVVVVTFQEEARPSFKKHPLPIPPKKHTADHGGHRWDVQALGPPDILLRGDMHREDGVGDRQQTQETYDIFKLFRGNEGATKQSPARLHHQRQA